MLFRICSFMVGARGVWYTSNNKEENPMKKLSVIIIMFLLVSGCSLATKAVPMATPGSVIDQKSGSATIEKDGIEVTTQLVDWNYFPYNLTNYFSPFAVTIKNKTTDVLNFETSNFFMYDENKTQYGAYTPKEVYGITSGELYYLIPYPYVGVYVYEGYRQFPTAGTREYPPIGVAGPQLYEVYPRDVYSQALPFGPLNPDAQLKGLVYFKGNLYNFKKIRIFVIASKPGGQKIEFEFPFEVK